MDKKRETYYIYCLICPISKEIKYVGQTCRFNNRMQQHMNYDVFNTDKTNHAAHLRSLGLIWDYDILEMGEMDREKALSIEEKWIRKFLNRGINLYNGEYYCLSEEKRKKRNEYVRLCTIKGKIRSKEEKMKLNSPTNESSKNNRIEYSY